MMPHHQQHERLEQIIRSAKPEFEFPGDLEHRVVAGIAAAPRSRPAMWAGLATRRRLVQAAAVVAVLSVAAMAYWSARGWRHVKSLTGVGSGTSRDVAAETAQRPGTDTGVGAAPTESPQDAPGLAIADRPPAKTSDSTSVSAPTTATIPPQPPLVVIAARGTVTDASSRPLKLGDKLPVGAEIITGSEARVTLVTRRGSEYTLGPNSRLVVEKTDSIALGTGRMYCQSRAGELKQITTNAGKIHLLGTTLEAAVRDSEAVAVTVVDGAVRLVNAFGEVEVAAGHRALLVASRRPDAGEAVNPYKAVSWYYGRDQVISDFGDIAYVVTREQARGLVSEVWTMNADGSDKHRLKSYLGWARPPGPWLPGQQWLVFNVHSVLWTKPDFDERRAHTGAGHPILDDQAWLISSPTGQDLAFDLPRGADPLYSDLSPDGTRFAFVGHCQADLDDPKSQEGGLWVFDLTTGEMTKLLDGYIKTPISWGPDSRHIVADTAQGYVLHHPLVVVDADAGDVQDLGVDGAGGTFSPDGRRIAYCGEFQRAGSWAMGVPISGRAMVYDLDAGKAIPISPEGEGALTPRWSPDGRHIAYHVTVSDERDPETGHHERTWALRIAAADGAKTWQALESNEGLAGYAWMPSGDALYLVTGNGVRIIAPGGSGTLADLGGNAQDSILSAEQTSQTEAALDAVREAVFQYAVGNVRRFEGKAGEAKAAFQTAADIFAGISWDYALAQFSHSQLLLYADTAAREASRPRDEILSQSCEERLRYLETLLAQYVGATGEFPPDLAALEKHSLETGWGINWISNKDTEWVKMMFRCPVSGSFTYSAPADEPDFGDVLVSCPSHPDHELMWTEHMGEHVAFCMPDIGALAFPMLVNFSKHGPRDLTPQCRWEYEEHGRQFALHVVSAERAADGATHVVAEVARSSSKGFPVHVDLAADRMSATFTWRIPYGPERKLSLRLTELKAGGQLEGEGGPAVIQRVETGTISSPAGQFQDALQVFLPDDSVLWIAPGTGIVAMMESGQKGVELVDYRPRPAD